MTKKATPYVVLIRGINVGGKNKMSMTLLRECLSKLGYLDVSTYIASGNVLLRSDKKPATIKREIEAALPKHFKLDSELIKVLVLSKSQLQTVVSKKPKGFGEEPTKYHSDVIFLIDVTPKEVLSVFDPREGVDTIWPGKEVIYSQRLSAMRTKSKLGKVIGTAAYKSMTIRSWATTAKLWVLLKKL